MFAIVLVRTCVVVVVANVVIVVAVAVDYLKSL